MFARFAHNWQYKLFAFFFACALHFYARQQANPMKPRVIQTELVARSLSPRLLLEENVPAHIRITLQGQPEDLSRVSESGVVAYTDLSLATAGKHSFPVHVEGIPTDLMGSAAVEPSRVTLTLLAAAEKRLPIHASPPSTSAAGYAYHLAALQPEEATVSGPRDVVETVARLTVQPGAKTGSGMVEDDFPILALDAQGSPVSGVTLTPASAFLRIELLKIPAAKTVLVSPDFQGHPPYPARVTDYEVRPPLLEVAGRPERLSQIKTVQTAPLDLSRETGTFTRRLPCVAPPGVAFSGPAAVTITVRIALPAAPSPAPVLPTPAPAAPPMTAPAATMPPADGAAAPPAAH